MRILATLILSILCGIRASAISFDKSHAAADSISLSGTVSDAFSRESMADVEVCVSDGNGFVSVTRSFTFKAQMRQFDRTYYEVKVSRAGKYVLTFMKDGYVTQSTVVDIPERKYMKRVTAWSAGDVLLSRGKDYKLGEATVTASRIMMVEHGDTIVYNAAAF